MFASFSFFFVCLLVLQMFLSNGAFLIAKFLLIIILFFIYGKTIHHSVPTECCLASASLFSISRQQLLYVQALLWLYLAEKDVYMHIDLYSWHFNLLHGLNKFASIKHTHANHGSKNNSLQTFRHFSMLFPVTALSLLGTMINTGRAFSSRNHPWTSSRNPQRCSRGRAEGPH